MNDLIDKICVHDDDNIKGFFKEYRWLSNFWPCKVHYEGLIYPSSENAYQAAKSTDQEVRLKFVNIPPKGAKDLGRIIEIRQDWKEVKEGEMFKIVHDKFTRNQYLKDKLINTGFKYLEETNYFHDYYWGVCKGKGENKLGHILMEIRRLLS